MAGGGWGACMRVRGAKRVLTIHGVAPLLHELPNRGTLCLAHAEVARGMAAVLAPQAGARRGVHDAHGRRVQGAARAR